MHVNHSYDSILRVTLCELTLYLDYIDNREVCSINFSVIELVKLRVFLFTSNLIQEMQHEESRAIIHQRHRPCSALE